MSERGEMICGDRGDISKCLFSPHTESIIRIPLHSPRSVQEYMYDNLPQSSLIHVSVIFHNI